jgi:hypothetical protein
LIAAWPDKEVEKERARAKQKVYVGVEA